MVTEEDFYSVFCHMPNTSEERGISVLRAKNLSLKFLLELLSQVLEFTFELCGGFWIYWLIDLGGVGGICLFFPKTNELQSCVLNACCGTIILVPIFVCICWGVSNLRSPFVAMEGMHSLSCWPLLLSQLGPPPTSLVFSIRTCWFLVRCSCFSLNFCHCHCFSPSPACVALGNRLGGFFPLCIYLIILDLYVLIALSLLISLYHSGL